MALKEEEEEDKRKPEEAWRLRVASEDLLWAVFIAMDANRFDIMFMITMHVRAVT